MIGCADCCVVFREELSDVDRSDGTRGSGYNFCVVVRGKCLLVCALMFDEGLFSI